MIVMLIATRPANGITINAGHPEILCYFTQPILFEDAAEAQSFAQKIGAEDGFDLSEASAEEVESGIRSIEINI